MISPSVAGVILVALIGWFATIRAISGSKLKSSLKYWLLIPSWIPWMVVALGAPILAGSLSLDNAINLGGAMTMGMAISIVVARRRRTKR
jgi:hypothetical protein